MCRRLLVTVLLLTTVLGPQFCCCKLGAWLTNAGTTAQDASQPGNFVVGSCCHRSALAPAGRSTPGNKHSCPCKKQSRDWVQTATIADASLGTLWASGSLWESLVTGAPTTISGLIKPNTVSSLAFPAEDAVLSGRDRLCSYQTFRC